MSKQKDSPKIKKEAERREELYLELKTLDEEIKKLNAHLENMDEQIAELTSNKEIMGKFSELKENEEIRAPLVSGVYLKGKLLDTKKVMINVGSGVAVEKTPEEVMVIFDGQMHELTVYREKLVLQMKSLMVRIEEIQQEFE